MPKSIRQQVSRLFRCVPWPRLTWKRSVGAALGLILGYNAYDLIGQAPLPGPGAAGVKQADDAVANKPAGGAKKKKRAPPAAVNPVGRPEGSIIGQTKRYYIWYSPNEKVWSLRSTSASFVEFTGQVRIREGKIKSVLPIGLRESATDYWRVPAERNVLNFRFKTGARSDGLDIKVEGDNAHIVFDLKAGGEQAPKFVFIGPDRLHPAEMPCSFPVAPPKPEREQPVRPKPAP